MEHWADGGRTRLRNLLSLCSSHHRAVHEEGYRVELLASGEARFYRPDGRLIPAAPPQPPVSGDPLRGIHRALAARGIEVDPSAGEPTWDGSPIDWGYAIQVLWRPSGGEN